MGEPPEPQDNRPPAVGLLCASLVDDKAAAETALREIADRHGYELVHVVYWWSRDPAGFWSAWLRDALNRRQAHAIVMISQQHAKGYNLNSYGRVLTPTTPAAE
ncbi:hypothetical protein [Nocardia wallacei]|uniref:hypothetical protein n=1 Tax=Nocardia wallacei TaxID=480035 RepID=UPI0024542A0B|nr:hypothetical protein [Nocardia wallacei]